MRWGRDAGPAVGSRDIEEVGRELELAAAEAPPPPRVEEVRVRLLASLDEPSSVGRSAAPGVLVAVVVLLLAIVVAIGAPSVGSLLEDAFRGPSPSPVTASPEPDASSESELDVSRVPRTSAHDEAPSGLAVTATGGAPSLPTGVPAQRPLPGDGGTPMPTPTPTPVPWPPSDPPVEVPSPPVEPPVPPSVGPPVPPGS